MPTTTTPRWPVSWPSRATPTRTESEFTLNGLWIGPSPQPSPPRRRLRAILAAVVALAVFGGALAAAVEALRGNASSRPGVASPTTAPGDVSAVLPELERFVEKQRGLRFTTPVRADPVSYTHLRAHET